MHDIFLSVPDDVMANFSHRIGSKQKASVIAKDAVAFYFWAVSEVARGRMIISSDSNGDNIVRVTMPSLEKAARSKH